MNHDQAKLTYDLAGNGTDWNGTLVERVREYLSFDAHKRRRCAIETLTPVEFADNVPPRKYLLPDHIELLAERLALAKKL